MAVHAYRRRRGRPPGCLVVSEADPNVGLDVLDQVPDVDGAVGVRQGGGD